MPEAVKSPANASSLTENLVSTAVNDRSQYPQLMNECNDDPLTPSDEEWMEPGVEYLEYEPGPAVLEEYSTTKEIYMQAFYITQLHLGSRLSVFRRWRDCLKV